MNTDFEGSDVPNVMWVDEQQGLWMALADHMEKRGVKVWPILDARQCLEALEERTWSVVVLDMIIARGGVVPQLRKSPGAWLFEQLPDRLKARALVFSVVTPDIVRKECDLREDRVFCKRFPEQWQKLVDKVIELTLQLAGGDQP